MLYVSKRYIMTKEVETEEVKVHAHKWSCYCHGLVADDLKDPLFEL